MADRLSDDAIEKMCSIAIKNRVFASLPADVAKKIYLMAINLKNEENLKIHNRRVADSIFAAIKSVAHDLRHSSNVSNPVLEKYGIKMDVNEWAWPHDDDDPRFTFATKMRICVIHAEHDIVIKYKQAMVVDTDKKYAWNRRVPVREQIKIYRADGRPSKKLDAIKIRFADHPVSVCEQDVKRIE